MGFSKNLEPMHPTRTCVQARCMSNWQKHMHMSCFPCIRYTPTLLSVTRLIFLDVMSNWCWTCPTLGWECCPTCKVLVGHPVWVLGMHPSSPLGARSKPNMLRSIQRVWTYYSSIIGLVTLLKPNTYLRFFYDCSLVTLYFHWSFTYYFK
jgi:hypothetical protein